MVLLNICQQLERLNAEAAARTKRERRRANEVKTRTIQRMQLQMTAPLDIGLDQHDASLGLGQDDIFDLGGAETGLRQQGGISRLIGEDRDILVDSDEEDEEIQGEESDEVLDSEEEREKKMELLEAELDGLYDAYQDRLRERDMKFRVNESRKKNAEREEWHGIQETNSDDMEDESNEEGGWDKMEQVKKNIGGSSSDESDDDERVERIAEGRKRRHTEVPDHSFKPSKRLRLVTKLEEPKTNITITQAAQVWFSQDVFTGFGVLGDNEDGEGGDEEMNMDALEENDLHNNWEDTVSNIST